MADVTFEPNHDGFNKLLNGTSVSSYVKGLGDAIAQTAGDGFKAIAITANRQGYARAPRAACVVSARSKKARLAEATDKALTKAVYAWLR